MFLIILILIFIRPVISSSAFIYLNFVYSALFLLLLIMYIYSKKIAFFPENNFNYPVTFFIAALIISLVYSLNQINSLLEIYKYIGGLLLFLVAYSFSEEQQRLLLRAIAVCGLLISFLALYQYFFGFKHLQDYFSANKMQSSFISDYIRNKRVFAPFITPGILGGYLAMILPLCLINKKRLWFILPVSLALFFTKSISAMFSLFFGLAIYFYLRGRSKKKAVFYLILTFLFTMVVFVLRNDSIREHTLPLFSVAMRLNYWKDAFGIIAVHPIVGIGPGNFSLSLSRFAHNSYIQIWAELGIFGLFSYIWLVFEVLRAGFKSLKGSQDKNKDICLLAAAAVFLIHNFLDFTFFLPETVFTWWVILGLIASLPKKKPIE
ncbi:MAG: O-antigen ligase family protein [Candidatus Omnitrophota bacterium]